MLANVTRDEAVLVALVRQAARDGRARETRVAAGLSQADVAAVCGVSPQAVTRWERGERVPRTTSALEYGKLLTQLGLAVPRSPARATIWASPAQ